MAWLSDMTVDHSTLADNTGELGGGIAIDTSLHPGRRPQHALRQHDR